MVVLGCGIAGACWAGEANIGFSSGVSLRQIGPQLSRPVAAQRESTAARDARIWWQQADGPGLRLTYAGSFANQPDNKPAIALLFTGSFATVDNLQRYLSVRRPDGSPVPGHWRLSVSPQLLYFNVPEAGEYIVEVRKGLADANAQRLRKTLSGPVVVGNP